MAKSYLTPDELTKTNFWLKTVFFPCVLNDDTKYVEENSYNYWAKSICRRNCKYLYEVIVKQIWDISPDGGTEKALNEISKCQFRDSEADEYNTYKMSKLLLAATLANLCFVKQIWWDDKAHTPQQLAYFLKTTLGATLWNFKCFVTQDISTPQYVPTGKQSKIVAAKPAASGTQQGTQSAGNTTTNSTSSSSGPRLNISNAGGLVSKTKEILNVNEVYWVCGEFTNPGKTKPRLHVKPLNTSSSGILPVSYGSGQGYNDCIVYFDNLFAAKEFMQKADANKPASIASLDIRQCKAASNGYFKVNTQFGEGYIKAEKLNEMIESINKELDKPIYCASQEEWDEQYAGVFESFKDWIAD